ncbi:YdcF family protein [Oscillatoria sp. FACHB-1407]|uniref:YdcF family protein n=1 Tax=Oscillatoria sp. FACHB-1407 TaxID=2692847 RepID=UPI001684AB53|nr:YdcF family protein [Oscillatoria sp. FACHB-1407]MBD2461816.1 YdcF family protein [Oscillatoria sp. FACHB-1407]
MRSPHLRRSGKPRAQRKRVGCVRRIFSLVQVLLLVFAIAVAYWQLEGYLRQPQAILVLGGATEREVYAAQFAQEHPELPIWISSGSNPEYTEWVFGEAGIDPVRLNLDFRAVDTVTNFTTLADEFKASEIKSIYLITSDYHMRRARIIGGIVFGSRGIHFRTVAVPSQQSPESVEKSIRDGARAVLWVFTGRTGSSLGRFFSQ